jgi:hypothetical protein
VSININFQDEAFQMPMGQAGQDDCAVVINSKTHNITNTHHCEDSGLTVLGSKGVECERQLSGNG